MARIGLSESTFTLIPEGRHVFKIVDVVYDEDFGKMEVKVQTKDGLKHTERFSLLTKKGETNEGALKAFSYFARVALNNYNLDSIDHEDLLNCYFEATVTHEVVESTKDPDKELTFVRLGDWTSASGFGKGAKTTKKEEVAKEETTDDEDIDLDDFLD